MKFNAPPEIPVVTSLPSGKAGAMVVFNSTLYLYTTAWTTVGAVTPPAGSSGQIQVNNGGVFGSDVDFTWDGTTNSLILNGTDTGILLNGVTTEPSSVVAGASRFYSRNIAGRNFLKWKDSTGIDSALGAPQWASSVYSLIPTTSSSFQTIGPTPNTIGTISTPALTTGSLRNQIKRLTLTSAATAGSFSSLRAAAVECFSGSSAGYGGYFLFIRFGLSGTLATGQRAFIGLADSVAAPTNVDPTTSTTPGKIGLAINASTGNWNFVNNATGTAPTVLALGTTFPVNNTDHIELIIHCPPNGTSIGFRVTNLTSSATISSSISTNIPINTTFLGRVMWTTNNTVASAVAIDCSRFYLETLN